MLVVRAAKPRELSQLPADFQDERLQFILPRYKARNFPSSLTDEERADWEQYRYRTLMGGGTESRLAKYMQHLDDLVKTETSSDKRYLLEELKLYAESIMPVIETDQ
jgi:exodeoxyribonuclease-1